jgi:hypothetical protein
MASGRSVLERWRERRAIHKRRVLVQWLRRTANHTHEPHPIARSRHALLHYRAAAVRSELLEIAHDPDPACVTTLHELLANGCDSPLYNPDVHVSELRAAVYYVRAGIHDAPDPTAP